MASGSEPTEFELIDYPPTNNNCERSPSQDGLTVENSRHSALSESEFLNLFDRDGRIIDSHRFHQAVFRGKWEPYLKLIFCLFWFNLRWCWEWDSPTSLAVSVRLLPFFFYKNRAKVHFTPEILSLCCIEDSLATVSTTEVSLLWFIQSWKLFDWRATSVQSVSRLVRKRCR